MSLGQIVLLVYALLMVVGGVMGYVKGGSRPSLIAGAVSGLLLFVALFISRSSPVAGLWIGAVVSLLLCITFAMRLAKTGTFMPSGMLLMVSVVALVLLTWAALGAQRKL